MNSTGVSVFDLITVLITVTMVDSSVNWLVSLLFVTSFLAISHSLLVNFIFVTFITMAGEMSV